MLGHLWLVAWWLPEHLKAKCAKDGSRQLLRESRPTHEAEREALEAIQTALEKKEFR